jgi:hypothetical protein
LCECLETISELFITKIKGILVFNATLNNIAVILVEETVVSGEKHIGLLQVQYI